jgi:chemotaxis protein MotB
VEELRISPVVTTESLRKIELEQLVEKIESMPETSVIRSETGLVISLGDAVLFESGKAEINPKGFPVLDNIVGTVRNIPDRIHVEGHTDDDPIHTEKFASNWELSTARAVNVVKYFIETGKIEPRRLSAIGYGESRPRFANDTPAHKARNRRVEIVVSRKRKKEP